MVPEGTPSQLRIAAAATLEPLKPHDWTQVTGGDPWEFGGFIFSASGFFGVAQNQYHSC